MSIDTLKDKIPDFAKDVRLNLGALTRDETLTDQQRYGLFLACAIATRNPEVIAAFEAEAAGKLTPAALDAARAAAAIMAHEQRLLPLHAPRLEQGVCRRCRRGCA